MKSSSEEECTLQDEDDAEIIGLAPNIYFITAI
jgi:hypothetical protein